MNECLYDCQPMGCYFLFRHQSTWIRQACNHDFINGKYDISDSTRRQHSPPDVVHIQIITHLLVKARDNLIVLTTVLARPCERFLLVGPPPSLPPSLPFCFFLVGNFNFCFRGSSGTNKFGQHFAVGPVAANDRLDLYFACGSAFES